METMKIYRLLQAHVGIVNALVVALYNSEITADEALAEAKKQIEATRSEIDTDRKSNAII